MSYLDDAKAGKQLTSATLMVALAELGPGAIMTLSSTGATVTLNGTECSAPLPEKALTGNFTPIPAAPPIVNAAVQADIAAAEADLAKAATDNMKGN